MYVNFFLRGGYWFCSFLQPDLKTPVCRGRSFASAEKVRELIAKTPTRMMSEDKQALEFALEAGRGGIWLDVTTEQYARLQGGPSA